MNPTALRQHGCRLGGSFASGAPAVPDPATQNASGFWEAPYTTSPWLGKASAGASLANGNLTSAGLNIPAASAGAVDFNGSSHYLASASNLSVFVGASAFNVSMLIWADTAGTASIGAAYSERAILTDDANGFFSVSHSTRGVTVSVFNGASWSEATVACGTAGWHIVHVWWDGVNVSAKIDSSAAVVGAALASYGVSPATALTVGKNYDGSAMFDGKVRFLMVNPIDIGAPARDELRVYVNATYGLSL